MELVQNTPPPEWSWQRQFTANPETINAEVIELRKALERQQINKTCSDALELTLAEALNNVCEHAFSDTTPGDVRVSVALNDKILWCEITDTGRAMPGGGAPEPKRFRPETLALHDLPEGGFGWGLIHDLVQGLCLERQDGINRLRFHFLVES